MCPIPNPKPVSPYLNGGVDVCAGVGAGSDVSMSGDGHCRHAQKRGEDRACSSEDMIADRHTHRQERHTRHNTVLPYRGRSNNPSSHLNSGRTWLDVRACVRAC